MENEKYKRKKHMLIKSPLNNDYSETKKSTDQLKAELENTENLEDFLIQNAPEFRTKEFHDYLQEMLDKYNLEKKIVIRHAELDATYGYQIFEGRKMPKRDKIIQLALGFPLDVDETQRALQLGGASSLYIRCKRDAYIMFALTKKMSLMETNQLLFDKNEETLH